MDTAQLVWGVLFGAIGAGYLVYARRQRNVPALLAGIALIVLPYLVTNTVALVVISLALIGVPWFFRS